MRYLIARCSTNIPLRAFGLSLASLLMLGLCVVLDLQPHPPQTSSQFAPLNQVADKKREAAILDAVANHKWDQALAEIKQLHERVLTVSDKAVLARNESSEKRTQAVVAQVVLALERERNFLAQVAESVAGTAPEAFLSQLSHERIIVNFRLIAVLDLRVAEQAWGNHSWSIWSRPDGRANDSISWFWDGVAAARAYYRPLKRYDWYSRSGVPLDVEGQPVFFEVPPKCTESLGVGEKILYLSSEIEQLDPTTEKHNAGRAMLYRARLARRLFGPTRDPEWEILNYDLNRRPSFIPKPEVVGLTPVNALSDNETRIQVGLEVRQLSLPAQHSPLALYRQLEQRYPNCDSLPRAMFEIAQFYQMRRQFTAATREYQRVLEEFPDHQRSVLAREQLGVMQRPSVLLGHTGVYLTGSQPQVWFTYRNTAKVEFSLRKLDIEQFLTDQVSGEHGWRRTPTIDTLGPWDYWSELTETNTGDLVAEWQVDLSESSMAAATGSTVVPHDEMGEFLLEARIPGTEQVSQAIILVTSAAIVHDRQADQSQFTLLDARTGERLPNETLRVIEYDKDQRKVISTTYQSDAVGEAGVPYNDESYALIYARSKNHGKAFLSLNQRVAPWTSKPIATSYTTTDRPAYRPGETVHFRSWYRRQSGDETLARPEDNALLQIAIIGPGGRFNKTLDLRCDEAGSVAGSISLGAEAPLGLYQVFVRTAEDIETQSERNWIYRVKPSTHFRVEEFKRPEFRVSVAPRGASQTDADNSQVTNSRITNAQNINVQRDVDRNDLAFEIQANYYFGDPVAGADAEYALHRRFKPMTFAKPQTFDWLYGAGYGRYGYLYPWLGDAIPQVRDPNSSSWRTAGRRGFEVAQGATKLDANGRAVVRFDPDVLFPQSFAAAQFTLTVDVRDDSRRSVTAEGTKTLASRSYFTFAELDQGWYTAGERIEMAITTLDANSAPVQRPVSVELFRVGPLAAIDATAELELIEVLDATTAEDGIATLNFGDLTVGQYRAVVSSDVDFREARSANDLSAGNALSQADKRPFSTAVNFVVYGDALNSQKRLYGDLELIPNARTYQPGDTARILVNTNLPPLQLLLEDSLGEQRAFQLNAQSSVIELPVTQANVPSTLYRASAVRDGKMLRERFDLFVPPVDRLLQVAVEADAAEYRPGSDATVQVAVKDQAGNPVSGDVVLAAYDASVLAFQPEHGIGPKQLILETKPSAWRWQSYDPASSLGTRQFDTSGDFFCPEYSLADEMFYGPWTDNDRSAKDEDPDHITTHRSVGMGGMPPETGDFTPTAESGAVTQANTATTDEPSEADDEDGQDPNAARRQYVQPVVRQNYSATAAWMPHLRLDDQGRAKATFPLPDSLTTWKLRAYSITPTTQLGDGSGVLLTSKPLMVRLQTPRFLVEQDQAVITANVHNTLAEEKDIRVELLLPTGLLQPEQAADAHVTQSGEVVLVREGRVAAGTSQRFEWRLRAIQPGIAQLTVKALTDEASDAMVGTLPIVPFAMPERQTNSLVLKPRDDGEFKLDFELPNDLRAGSLRAELTATGSPANALFEAIPFLIDYPYGCVEQTMSRFYPLAIAADTLRRLDIAPEELKQRAETNPRSAWQGADISQYKLLDSEQIERIADLGLQRLYRFQHQDGGWGWWEDDASSPFMTAYVLVGLHTADKAGIVLRGNSVERGRQYLASWFRDGNRLDDDSAESQSLAYMVYALSLPWDNATSDIETIDSDDDGNIEELEEVADPHAREVTIAFRSLLKRESELNHYGRCLLAVALQNAGKKVDAKRQLQKLLAQVKVNDETAALTTSEHEWWRWWNSEVETNAWLLRALSAIEPENPLTGKIVQGLVNRRHTQSGKFWRSTRDAALAVLALSEYMAAEKLQHERIKFDYAVDDQPLEHVDAPDVPFHPDTQLQLAPAALQPGQHTVRVSKSQGNHLRLNLTVDYQRIVETIPPVQEGIAIQRSYRRVPRDGIEPANSKHDDLNPHNSDGQETFSIGDIIEVEIRIRTQQPYEYLAFEDPKPAGCEPLQLRSGSTWDNGLWANVELRDQKVVFFASYLRPGEHVLKYKLRAETPGTFRSLPTIGFAMYTPEIRGGTTEQTVVIVDR